MGYKFYMLLKRLLRQVASILPWVIGCAVIVGAIVLCGPTTQHAATEKYEAAREERCASSFPFDSEKQETCKHERDGPGNYLPWGYELVAWPEGITCVAALRPPWEEFSGKLNLLSNLLMRCGEAWRYRRRNSFNG